MKKIDIIHGPNLNLLGSRETEIYGTESLESINSYVNSAAEEYGIAFDFFQSNHEGQIIDRIHSAENNVDGVVINPAAFTHYSIAIRDAIAAIKTPVVEVHLTDISQREAFRKISVSADVCVDQICGFGKNSYFFGVEALVGHWAVNRIRTENSSTPDNDKLLRSVVEILHESFPKYDWTGIYLVDGDALVLHNFQGAPSPHTRIPIGQGICGAAVAEEESIIVPDVNADPRYLACSIETKSEIVVPIYSGKNIIGEIDIDSHRPDVFHKHDQKFLEQVAAVIGEKWK